MEGHKPLGLLHAFAMERGVEPFRLLVPGDSKPDQGIDDLQDDPGPDGREGTNRQHAIELGQELPAVAVDQTDGHGPWRRR